MDESTYPSSPVVATMTEVVDALDAPASVDAQIDMGTDIRMGTTSDQSSRSKRPIILHRDWEPPSTSTLIVPSSALANTKSLESSMALQEEASSTTCCSASVASIINAVKAEQSPKLLMAATATQSSLPKDALNSFAGREYYYPEAIEAHGKTGLRMTLVQDMDDWVNWAHVAKKNADNLTMHPMLACVTLFHVLKVIAPPKAEAFLNHNDVTHAHLHFEDWPWIDDCGAAHAEASNSTLLSSFASASNDESFGFPAFDSTPAHPGDGDSGLDGSPPRGGSPSHISSWRQRTEIRRERARLTSDASRANERADAYREQLATARRQIADARAQLSEEREGRAAMLSEAEEGRTWLEEQLEDARREAERSASDASRAKERANVLAERLSEAEERIARLEEEAEAMEDEMDRMIDEMERLVNAKGHEGEIVEFIKDPDQKGIQSLMEESLTADAADVDYSSSDSEGSGGGSAVLRLRRELDESRAESARLAQERDAAADDVRRLSLQLSELKLKGLHTPDKGSPLPRSLLTRTTLAASLDSLDSLPSARTTEFHEAICTERNGLRRKLEEAAAGSSALEGSLASSWGDNMSLSADVHTSKLEVENLRAWLEANLAEASNGIERRTSEVDGMRLELEEGQAALSGLKSKGDEFASNPAKANGDLGRLETERIAKSNDQEDRLPPSQSENKSLSADLDASQNIKQETYEVSGIRLELEHAQVEFSIVKSERDELASDLNIARRDLKRLEMEKEGAITRSNDLEGHLVELQIANTSLLADLAASKAENKDLHAQLEANAAGSSIRNIQMAKEADGIRLKLEKARTELSALKSDHDAMVFHLDEARGDIARLQVEKEAAVAGKNGLEEDVIKLQAHNKGLGADLHHAKSRNEYLQTQLKAGLSDFSIRVKQKTEEVNAMHLEFEEGQAALSTLKSQHNELASSLDEARGDVARLKIEATKSHALEDSLLQLQSKMKSLLCGC